jgi:hypothetical protein
MSARLPVQELLVQVLTDSALLTQWTLWCDLLWAVVWRL